jgi:uncharacterized membrane protein (UPF0127 family)
MKVLNINKQTILGTKILKAESFFQRLKGLIGTGSLDEGTGLLIAPCSSVHTCFMRYPIDVIFLDEDDKILHIIHSMQPYRFSPIVKGAKKVLELPTGICVSTGTSVKDQIEVLSLQ